MDLMSAIKHATKATSESIERGESFQEKSNDEVRDFFRVFFTKQNEVKDIDSFIELVALDKKYGFIAGAMLSSGKDTIITIKQ